MVVFVVLIVLAWMLAGAAQAVPQAKVPVRVESEPQVRRDLPSMKYLEDM
jgi:Na+-transporting methylmalonyl-CoA/oxaloacetate decarboxylase gamma subunit